MAKFAVEYANWEGLRTLCLTFDHDWAPDFMVSHVLDILDRYGVQATFLATNPTPALTVEAPARGHEVGLHPNLAPNSTQGRNIDEVIEFLHQSYPAAQGTRFHLLGHSYRDLMTLSRAGFVYDVSALRFNCPYLLPAWHDDLSMALLTYCWEDGYTVDGTLFGTADSIELDTPGMKICNFHPINIFMNWGHNDQKEAFRAKVPNLADCSRDEVAAYRQSGAGAETVLIELLERARSDDFRVVPVQELVSDFKLVQR